MGWGGWGSAIGGGVGWVGASWFWEGSGTPGCFVVEPSTTRLFVREDSVEELRIDVDDFIRSGVAPRKVSEKIRRNLKSAKSADDNQELEDDDPNQCLNWRSEEECSLNSRMGLRTTGSIFRLRPERTS